LPPNIGIPVNDLTLPVSNANSLDWETTTRKSICFDSRGILESTDTKIVLKDFQGFNKASLAELELTTVGGVDIKTYNSSNTLIPLSSQGNPEF
jgi:hypothetical protein